MRARRRWEDAERDAAQARADLAQFQGPAQTTAQRYTENPTDHPGMKSGEDCPVFACIHALGHSGPHTIPSKPPATRAVTPDPTRQDLPVPNGDVEIQPLVIEDLKERMEVGRARYGTLLQPFNGRDALRDAYEEVLDLAVYLRQMHAARQADEERLIEVVLSAWGASSEEYLSLAKEAVQALSKAGWRPPEQTS